MSSIALYLSKFPKARELRLVGPMPLLKPISPLIEPVIFVDGGLRWREGAIGFGVGDGDSGELRPDLLLPRDKDHSDLAYVLKELPQRLDHLTLDGFSGGRRDHELLVWGEIHHFLKRRPGRVSIDEGVFAISGGQWKHNHRGLFSIVSFEPTQVRLTGSVRYPIEDWMVLNPVSSLGLSNVATGSFELECTGPTFMFLNPTE